MLQSKLQSETLSISLIQTVACELIKINIKFEQFSINFKTLKKFLWLRRCMVDRTMIVMDTIVSHVKQEKGPLVHIPYRVIA